MTVDQMSGAAALVVIAGFLAVWLTAFLNSPGWSPGTKRFVAVAVAGVLGLVAVVLSGYIQEIPPDVVARVERIVGYVGMTIVAGQGFYAVLKDPATQVEWTMGTG